MKCSIIILVDVENLDTVNRWIVRHHDLNWARQEDLK
jgi:hypothetical protein